MSSQEQKDNPSESVPEKDEIADDWWFNKFQNQWLQPIEIVMILLLIFLFMRWISLSGYPIFGVLWVPLFMYFGRGMNAFYERVNASTLKSDDKGLFWTLFDPMHPVDPESNLNPMAPPIVGNIKIYTPNGRFLRFWVALLQVVSSLVNGMIAYWMLIFRLFWSFLYIFKDNKWIHDHGLDGFYTISETPLNVWAENGSVRGPSPDGPQTDVQGNSLNFMTTISQRINWVATLGMDRTLYANLHLLPIFRVSESRFGWFVMLSAMYLLVSKAFVWTGVVQEESLRYGWYFVLVWLGILLLSWWKGGFQLWYNIPPIRSFFMGEEETWGEPSRFSDFFRTLLRNQYDRKEGSLPTKGPLSEALTPKQIIKEPTEFQPQNINQESIPMKQEFIQKIEDGLHKHQFAEKVEDALRQVGGNNAVQQGVKEINRADRLLLPTGSFVPQEVLDAEATYVKKVIPTVVYEAQIMTDKRIAEKAKLRQEQEKMEQVVASTPDPTSQPQREKTMMSLAEDLVAATATSPNKPMIPETKPKAPEQQPIVEPMEKEQPIPETTEPIPKEEPQRGGHRKHIKESFRNASRITPITWIPVPTSWMGGIPE